MKIKIILTCEEIEQAIEQYIERKGIETYRKKVDCLSLTYMQSEYEVIIEENDNTCV